MIRKGLAASVALLLAIGSVGAATTIYFPAAEELGDERSDYQLMLLRMIFDKEHGEYRVERTKTYMQQGRALEELARGSGIVQVVASMTSVDRESRLLPIRIPVFKGLIGWRIPLVPADQPDLLKQVKTVEDLRHFRAGQGADWPDTTILRANRLPVDAATSYGGMFRMLGQHRFDYFPRSIVEIAPEERKHRDENVIMDRHIVLHYPATVYFFVNKRDTHLAEAIRSGLESVIADGSFDKMFYAYHRQFIEQSDLAHRTVIELDNPLLPPETPRQRTELWWRPSVLNH